MTIRSSNGTSCSHPPVIVLKQVAQHDATRLLVRVEPDELGAAVGGADGVFREHPADLVRFVVLRAAHVVPNLLLTRLVAVVDGRPEPYPSSASNFDPFGRRVLMVALVSSELAGIAETRRARVA